METPAAIKLPVLLEQQQGGKLCWAAVTLAIAQFYGGDQGISQKELAISVFGPESYDHVLSPRQALEMTGNFRDMVDVPLTGEEILNELQHGNPIVACMRYFVGWHLAIIYGMSASGKLFIADSLHGNSEITIADFKDGYLGYCWTHSFLTQKGIRHGI